MNASSSPLILIVDDTPTNLEVISESLSDSGYDIAIATSGERALQQVKYKVPDLILLDIMMPGMDGFETYQHLKEVPKLVGTPIIFMTAIADLDNKVKGLDLGAVDYIVKPFQEQEVLARIKTHLRLKQAEERVRQSEERLDTILNSLEEVVWSATPRPFKFLYLNTAIEKIYNCPRQDFLEQPELWFQSIHPDDSSKVENYFQNFTSIDPAELEFRIVKQNSEVRWLRLHGQVSSLENTTQLQIDGIMHDVSDRKQFEMQLIHDARHDPLTGLGNRLFFSEQVKIALQQAKKDENAHFAILFVDLDRFKVINDSLGHDMGDLLLVKVSQLLRSCLRSSDTVARLGGDEFTILLKLQENPIDAIRVAERISKRLKAPIELEGHSMFVTASIGIAIYSNEYSLVDDLLRAADIAMYQAKKKGKDCYQLFNTELYEHSVRTITLETEMRLAIKRDEFILHYQPIVNLASGCPIGFEALVRWNHPQQGLIFPGDFIGVAEESGLIEPLGEQLLWQACQQLRTWQESFTTGHEISICVNLSGKQLQSRQFLPTLELMLAETGVSPANLNLEITESLLIENDERIAALLGTLSEMGFELSLDDFGTGYSSLSYLHRFPIHCLKIDRSFINRIDCDRQSYEIVKTIITLAKTLNKKVIAEGIENKQQVVLLSEELQCSLGQGYYFSKPLPSELAGQWFRGLS